MASSAITGLVVDSDNVPNFKRDSDEAYVNDNWADNRWNDNSVVGFRDCSIKISTSLPACVQFQITWNQAAGRFGWKHIDNLYRDLRVVAVHLNSQMLYVER